MINTLESQILRLTNIVARLEKFSISTVLVHYMEHGADWQFYRRIRMSSLDEQAKESDYLRDERIFGTNNGATLRTRVIKNKKAYKRKKKVNLDDES
jgi:hypothetical protein